MNTSIQLMLIYIALALTSTAAWFTHVITTLMAGKYVLLLVGGLIPPIGVIHGIGLWFGVQW